MSQGPQVPGADPTGGQGGQQELSEEQIRAYLSQLRQADVSEIVAQAFSMLAQGAEVKLGRQDARTLIDAVTAITEQVGDTVDERLKDQMEQVVNQLRMAQIDAEKQLAQMREEGRLPDEETGEVPADASPPDEGEAAGQSPPQDPSGQQRGAGQPGQGSDASSRLWIPGR